MRKGLLVALTAIIGISVTTYCIINNSAKANAEELNPQQKVTNASGIDNQIQQVSLTARDDNQMQQVSLITKDDIQNKIVNSIDYFNSAEGSFTWYMEKSNTDMTIDYKVKIKDKPSSYEKITFKEGVVIENLFDGKNKETYNNKDKTYKTGGVVLIDGDSSKYSIKNRYYKSGDGTPGVYLRQDPSFMGYAKESLFNQNVALGFLEDQSKWDMKNGETFLGLDTVVINGTFSDYYSNKLKANTYKLWVEKNTGIILKMELYAENGDVVEKLDTTSIKLNCTIDDNAFKKDKTGYSNLN